jgi:NADH-quinone oxidoreductase subunit D
MLEGFRLADVPIIIAAIDPCYSCTDRAVRVHGGGDERLLSWEQLRQIGVENYRARGIDPGEIRLRQF